VAVAADAVRIREVHHCELLLLRWYETLKSVLGSCLSSGMPELCSLGKDVAHSEKKDLRVFQTINDKPRHVLCSY